MNQTNEQINQEQENAETTTENTVVVENQSTEQSTETVPETSQEAPKAEENKDVAKPEEKTENNVAEAKQKHYEEIFTKLKDYRDNGTKFEVEVKARIRGGLRVLFDDMPLFLPASHFSLKKNPTEDELAAYVGRKIEVAIHELQEEENRKTVIVSRRQILEGEFWNNINIGDKVTGTVSSIAKFGVFLDLGGIEGLIHISRLSQVHIEDPKTVAKKGDILEAVIVEINKETNRIALSRKELEESPWKGATELFPVDSQHKGIVRRLTDFGAYIELKPGIDGLLRNTELSWTKRIKSPAEVLKKGEEVDVKVISISEEKQTLSLSHKRTKDNPWDELKAKLPIGNEMEGTVSQVMPQGIIVSIEGEVDGFMPRSKMVGVARGKKIPYEVGQKVEIIVADLIPEQESLILAPKLDEAAQKEAMKYQQQRRSGGGGRRTNIDPSREASSSSSFSFGDLLSEEMKKSLADKLK